MKPEPPKQETNKSLTKISKIVNVVNQAPSHSSALSLTLLNSLQELRRRLELAESGLTNHLHIPLGENSVHECSLHIQKLQVCHFSFIFLSN